MDGGTDLGGPAPSLHLCDEHADRVELALEQCVVAVRARGRAVGFLVAPTGVGDAVAQVPGAVEPFA